MNKSGQILALVLLSACDVAAIENVDDEVALLQTRQVVAVQRASETQADSLSSVALTASTDPTDTAECSFVYPGNGLTCTVTLTVGCCTQLNLGVQNGPPCHNEFDGNAAMGCFMNMGECCSSSLIQNATAKMPSLPPAHAPPALALTASKDPTDTAECSFVYPGNGLTCTVTLTVGCCTQLNLGVQNGPPCHNEFDGNAAMGCFMNMGECCSSSLIQNATAQMPSMPPAHAPPAPALAASQDPTDTAECSFVYPGNGLTCTVTLTVGCCTQLNLGVQNGPPCHNEFDGNAAMGCFMNMGECCSSSLIQNATAKMPSVPPALAMTASKDPTA